MDKEVCKSKLNPARLHIRLIFPLTGQEKRNVNDALLNLQMK
jgi:hypothetical protein